MIHKDRVLWLVLGRSGRFSVLSDKVSIKSKKPLEMASFEVIAVILSHIGYYAK